MTPGCPFQTPLSCRKIDRRGQQDVEQLNAFQTQCNSKQLAQMQWDQVWAESFQGTHPMQHSLPAKERNKAFCESWTKVVYQGSTQVSGYVQCCKVDGVLPMLPSTQLQTDTFSEQKVIIFLILHYFLTRKSHSRCQLIPWTSPWAGSSSSLPYYEGRGGRQVQAQVCSWHIVDKDRDLCAWTHTLGTQTFCSRGFSEYFICKTACAEFCRSQKSFPGRGTTDSRD